MTPNKLLLIANSLLNIYTNIALSLYRIKYQRYNNRRCIIGNSKYCIDYLSDPMNLNHEGAYLDSEHLCPKYVHPCMEVCHIKIRIEFGIPGREFIFRS